MNLDNLACRRIIEENHSDNIIQLLDENRHPGDYRYVATISPSQVNMCVFLIYLTYRYDNEDVNTGFGFFAHYEVEKTEYFKGGVFDCS